MVQSVVTAQQLSLHEIICRDYDNDPLRFLETCPELDVSRAVFERVIKREYTSQMIGKKKWQALSDALEIPLPILQKHTLPPLPFSSIQETPGYQCLDREVGFTYRGRSSQTFHTFCKARISEGKLGFIDMIFRGYWNIESRGGNNYARYFYEKLTAGTSISFLEFFPVCYWDRERNIPPMRYPKDYPKTITNAAESVFDGVTFAFSTIDRNEFIGELLSHASPSLTRQQYKALSMRLQGYSSREIEADMHNKRGAYHPLQQRALSKFPPEIAEQIRKLILRE